MGCRILAVCISLLLLAAPPALAEPFPDSVPLPDDFQPEGIDVGPGATFYVGSLTSGEVYRGSLRSGEGEIFTPASAGGFAVGLKADVRRGLLFVAGGLTAEARVYDLRTGAPVAVYDFAAMGAAFLNDVVVTARAAYFTDSFGAALYRIPISGAGELGPGEAVPLSGPAAFLTADVNLNGIDATRDGATLIVSHTTLGALYTVDPATGESADLGVGGLTAGTVDGLLLEGRRLWVVENFANRLVEVRLAPDLSAGTIVSETASPLFRVPSTVARHGRRLALVNARFDLGFPPPFGPGAPPGTDFDVAVIRAP